MRAAPRPARSKPRRHRGEVLPSTSGLAILSRAPPVGEAVLTLTPDIRDGERIAQRLDLPTGLRILNLHLTHLRDEAAARARSAQLAQALAWARADWAGPLLVCGDLNMGRGDPGFAPLEDAAGDELGPTVRPAGVEGPPRPGRAVDHCVLLQPGGLRVARRFLALREADAAGRLASDHAAVVVDLST